MDIQILRQERMSQTGSSLMSLMQDQSIRKLDLLVREAVQNSLDASLDRSKKTRVEVDFVTGKFSASELNAEFGHIKSRLNSRYPEEKYEFIAIRDSGTFGLTETDHVSVEKSRLHSLIYHISKGQKTEGSGGQWGIGKTTFFRIGMGLVIYYSRTRENGEYRSKLAAALVEDETANPLVTEEDSRGISFFGKYDSVDRMATVRDVTIPITDENYIERFLGTFGILPYASEQTGTTIIMPYTNFGTLLKEVKPSRVDKTEGRDPTWAASVDDYLRIAVQRWYSPRLSNPEYDGSWLKASINGKSIARDDIRPLFRLILELYNASSNPNYNSEFLQDFNYRIAPIRCSSVKGQVAGHIGAVYTTAESLKLTDEYFRNAYSYIGEYEAALTSPIITFTRKPGMLIRYVTENSPWVPSLRNLDDTKILICVFKLASDKMLTDNRSLEEYIRARERADHNNWENETELNIVYRISKNTSSELRRMFSTGTKSELNTRSSLSEMFADLFLPRTNESSYRSEDLSKGTGSRTKGRSGKKVFKSKFEITSSFLSNDSREICFTVSSGSAFDTVDIYATVNSERGSMDSYEWENEFGKAFPLSAEKFVIDGIIDKDGNVADRYDTADLSRTSNSFKEYVVYTKKSSMGVKYGISVRANRTGMSYTGRITVKSSVKSVSFEIKCVSSRVQL